MSIESRSAQYDTVFGDWRIEKLLGTGSGGNSAVFSMYRDNKNWREYSALKVIRLIEERGSREELSESQAGEYSKAAQMHRERAEQEVLFMDQLRGKTNIVDYLDHRFCEWQDSDSFGVDLLIRMEKLTDLRSQMKKTESYSAEQIVRIGKDVCQALQICHKKSILHRDIKPENIFFNEDGDYKLGDFGVSKIMSNTPAAIANTGIGTAAYSAPEQFSGAYDRRVDIYSLGLVLYELSNGNRLPFARSSYVGEKEIKIRLAGKPLPVPKLLNLNSQAEMDLWRVIQKACAFRPEDRYQSAEEMLRELSKLDPYGTAPADPVVRDWKDSLKKYMWLLPVLLVVAVAAVFLLRGEEKPEGTETTPPAHVHNWEAATCEQPARCSVCGETDGEALGHAWVFLGCDTPRHCATCGFNEETALGHSWMPATMEAPATCEQCGATQGVSAAEEVLSSAAALAQSGQYLAAIRQLQEAWDTYGYEEFYNAAAKYRTEFSVYNMSAVAAGKKNTALLNSNGAVTVVGDSSNGELEADDWTNMRAVGLGDRHIAGLTKDGIVVAVGRNKEDQYTGVQLWQNVVDLAVSDFHTVGLLADGTVVSSVGFNHAGQAEVENLMYAAGGKRIVAVSAGYDHTLALLEDGTVVGCGDRQTSKNNYNGSCAVGSWTDIAAIYSGTEFSAGLRLDGTVVVAGMDWNMSDWTDIVNLAAGDYFLLGLKSDGTVVYKAVYDKNTDESFRYGCLQVEQWRNIVHIAAGSDHSVAVAADGTVYCIGANDKGQCTLNRRNRNG